MEGPDHQASLLPDEFGELITLGNQLKLSLGSENISNRTLSQGALLNKENLGKSIVARNFIPKGSVLSLADVLIRSPGQGLAATELNKIVGKTLQTDVRRHEFILHRHFDLSVNMESNSIVGLNNWGVPVRPHDVLEMDRIFDAPVYEFHISYKDLERPLPPEDWSKLLHKNILVHAPELFANSHLLDLCNVKEKDLHISNINLVCKFARKIARKIGTGQNIRIVTNIGGFSTHDFRAVEERPALYNLVGNHLKS